MTWSNGYVILELGSIRILGGGSVKYLIGLLVLLNVLDGILTNRIINLGVGRESNPFLLDLVGQPGFIVLKVVGVLLCSLILWDIHRHHPRLGLASTSCFVAAYTLIVFWNLGLLLGPSLF